MSKSAPSLPPPRTARGATVVACLILAIFAGLGLHHARSTSPTFDEPDQIVSGYVALTEPGRDYLVVNLRLSQLWQALPLLSFDPRPRVPSVAEERAPGQNKSLGALFFYGDENGDPQRMIFASRAMVVILSVILGGVIFACSRRLHGDGAGLLSLALYAFSPLVIAHGSLATTEMATALLFTLATLALWRVVEAPGPIPAVLAGLATGALLATKISGLLIVPIAVILVVARIRDTIRRRRPSADIPPRRLWTLAAALGGAALLAWAVVWLVYGGPSAAPSPGAARWQSHPALADTLQVKAVDLAYDWRLLPREYLEDLHRFAHASLGRQSYLLGEYSLTGWWSFFPVAGLFKTTLALLLALLLAGFAAWKLRRVEPKDGGADLRGLFPFLVLAAVYGAFAIAGNLNIGARHLLPLYPPLLVLAGLSCRLWASAPRIRRTLLACALAFGAALETAWAFPHFIGHFNALAGGSRNGRHILVDSSLDWGESLPDVKRWLDRRDARPAADKSRVYFSYFGNVDLARYGLSRPDLVLLPQYYDTRVARPFTLGPGSYVISATMLACVYTNPAMGSWRPSLEKAYWESLAHMAEIQPHTRTRADFEAFMSRGDAGIWKKRFRDFDYLRFARLCAYLRQREPDEYISPGMLVFEVSLEDLEKALAGPPPELRPEASIKGAERFADEDLPFIR